MSLSSKRNNTVLLGYFDDIIILFKYLYMSEAHKIIVTNGLCELEIGMRPDLKLSARNLNFPNLPAHIRPLELEETLAMIDQLKEQKAIEFPEEFDNRWDEIKNLTLHNLALNYFNYKSRD